jgi:hypothetical protein
MRRRHDDGEDEIASGSDGSVEVTAEPARIIEVEVD